MGAVYRAWDTTLDIPVALKEMIPDPNAAPHTLDQLRQQFKREAQVVAGLAHPNLVRVIDFFEEGGNVYLVMNFVEGESLAERIQREGAQPEAQVLEWAQQLLSALAHCHTRGMIHRDLKPQNIIITPEGNPVMVDFGLVKLWDPQNPRTQTVIQAMGTPEYAPPEQYSTFAGHTDPRSDLYSLGATLYHALTGQAPISATDRMAMPERFVAPRKLTRHVSPQTEAVVLKAMALPISQRYDSAQAMADALLDAPAAASPAKHSPRPPRRPPIWVWILGLGFLCVCSIGAGLLVPRIWGSEAANPPPTPTTPPDTATPAPAPTSTLAQGSPTAVPASPTPALLSIVFDSYRDGNWEVYRVDESGSGLVNLTRHSADDGDPAWSFDGSQIAFDSDRSGNWDIYAMDRDGTGVTRLTDHAADEDSPAWSPDGSRIAFKSNRDGNWEIYVVRLDDLSVTNLTNAPSDERVPAWSPDGQRIAFVSDQSGDWDIWVMDADGSNPVNLTRHPDQDSFPAWSPDGQRIAFHSYRDGNAEIYVMNADGSNLVQLTDHPADDWGPSWSADGQRLAFTSDRDGNNEIYITMDVSGRNVMRVTHNSASDTWPVWSPTR
jgi:Tol biopolymer transport system component/tRNA A-37 threonylcarbamoyl transferase component Bud32